MLMIIRLFIPFYGEYLVSSMLIMRLNLPNAFLILLHHPTMLLKLASNLQLLVC